MPVHASFVQADINTSGTVGFTFFLLFAKLGVIVLVFQFMELKFEWLTIMLVGLYYSAVVPTNLVDLCVWLWGSGSKQPVYFHIADVERFVQNFRGHFIVSRSDQSHGYSFCTPMLFDTILIACPFIFIQSESVTMIDCDVSKEVNFFYYAIPLVFTIIDESLLIFTKESGISHLAPSFLQVSILYGVLGFKWRLRQVKITLAIENFTFLTIIWFGSDRSTPFAWIICGSNVFNLIFLSHTSIICVTFVNSLSD